jgi:hypothetical protein
MTLWMVLTVASGRSGGHVGRQPPPPPPTSAAAAKKVFSWKHHFSTFLGSGIPKMRALRRHFFSRANQKGQKFFHLR